MKKRLDEELLLRGLVSSRTEAKYHILEGKVIVNGRKAIKPSELVSEEDSIEIVKDSKQFVSRGGIKLDFAISEFKISVLGKIALDVGSSTGGFTDCLLKHGASKVYAVDVGKGLIDVSLREDQRVILLEGINARYLTDEIIKEKVDIITIDVSFISVLKILNAVVNLMNENGVIIALIKPQFESERKYLRKGIIRDKNFHTIILREVASKIRNLGLVVTDVTISPIKGGKGNIEFFYLIKKEGDFVKDEVIDKIVGEAWERLS